jgi:hypothetical protein
LYIEVRFIKPLRDKSTVPGEGKMRKLGIAFSLLLAASLFGCNVKHTISDNNNPPVIVEPPDAPGLLRGEAISSSSIRLTWIDNSDNEEYFAVYRREGEEGSFALCYRVFFNTTVYEDLGLQDSTTYSYYVTAERGDTCSGPSNTVAVTTPARGAETDLEIVGSLPFQSNGACMANGEGGRFHIATRSGMVYFIDVYDPTNPHIVQSYQAPGEIYSIFADIWLYLAMGPRGIQDIYMDGIGDPQVMGGCDTPGSAIGICPAGLPPNYLYIIDGASLQVIDSQMNPEIHGEFRDGSMPAIYDAAIELFTNDIFYLYLACGDAGLHVLRVEDILSPTVVGHLDIPGGANIITIDNESQIRHTLYLLNSSANLYIVDASDRGHPALEATLEIGNSPRAIFFDNNLVYVAFQNGIKIVDVSDPSAPSLLAFYQDTNNVSALKAFGGHLYFIDNAGLKIARYPPQG